MVPLEDIILTSMLSPLILCISLLSIFILYLSVSRRNFSKTQEKPIPSPPRLPFVGNLHQIGSLYHQSLYFLSLKYGPLMLLRLGEVPWLIVSSSDMACSIVRTQDLTFASRPSAVVADILRFGNVAFEPYGEDWRQLKKLFTIHLLSNKKNTSYRTIREDEDAFGGGIDTTYITIDWAMAELIKNPKPLKKLQEEVRGIVKQSDMVRSEDLQQMSYLKAVIKETLRLHPPGPLLVPRESMEECKINGFTIPKGTKVLINAWAIGRETKSWETPDEFMPERFIDSHVDYKGNDFQFIPFGAGRRICPGISFATAMAELVLANLVHRFDWELPSGMTREEFDMSESPGFSVHRMDELRLVVKEVLKSL